VVRRRRSSSTPCMPGSSPPACQARNTWEAPTACTEFARAADKEDAGTRWTSPPTASSSRWNRATRSSSSIGRGRGRVGDSSAAARPTDRAARSRWRTRRRKACG
jgi:hypothetical protein